MKKLLSKIENLEKDKAVLELRLVEKQEHINKTNSYWKKKMHLKG